MLISDGTNTGNDYAYDLNGNLTSDANKDITNITYNHLNLPTSIIFNENSSQKIEYFYDANGVKLKKRVNNGGSITETLYAGNFMYRGGSLDFYFHPEGYVERDNGSYKYYYQYKDHLGNIRVTYDNVGSVSSPSASIVGENNYYPFGLQHRGYNDANGTRGSDFANNYMFGGKEFQDEPVGSNRIDYYDFGARNYDPAIGRWMNIDALAENYYSYSSFNYTLNNPIFFIDPDGNSVDTIYEDEFGNTLAETNDGNDATVVISSENSEAFLEEYNSTSIMFRDDAGKNSEWIGAYGEGMVAEEGAKVQFWAVEALGHEAGYEGTLLAIAGLGMSIGEENVKGATFRLFNKRGTNFSPKLYPSGWLGGSAGKIKTFGLAKTGLSILGKALGAYNAYDINEKYRNGEISKGMMRIEQASNLFSTLGGIYGASWGTGWELGKAYGPSYWYGDNDNKWFE